MARRPNGDDLDDLDLFIQAEAEADPEFLAGMADIAHRQYIIRGLVECRVRSGITQGVVAKHMGTTQSAVSDIENGGGDLYLSTLQRYARAVGARAEVFVCSPATAVLDPDSVVSLGVARGGSTTQRDWRHAWDLTRENFSEAASRGDFALAAG